MSNDLEFHYVVSYREGYGWDIAADTESALFTDGTIYDWNANEWIVPNGDEEDIDLQHFRMLKYAIAQINSRRIEQLMEELNA